MGAVEVAGGRKSVPALVRLIPGWISIGLVALHWVGNYPAAPGNYGDALPSFVPDTPPLSFFLAGFASLENPCLSAMESAWRRRDDSEREVWPKSRGCIWSGPNLAVGREDPHQWMQQQGKAVQAYNGPGRAGTYHGARAVVGRGYPSPSGIGYPSPGAGGYPSASPGHPQHHPYSAATLNHYRSASPHNYPQSPRHRNMVLSGAVQVNSEPDGDSVSSSSTKMDFKKKRLKPGGVSGIKPPQVKRSSDAPVTLKGWLYKQGSDGLMLWKKRWFVLSEFCLYYYKGSEEEKQLGSILLPSYKISPCSSDDRVFRKWAFKIEHQNMRTYFFAAENKDSMLQWMNALSLASIMHKDNREKPGDGDGGFGARRPRSMDGKHWADVQHQPRISDPRLNVSYDMDPRASGKENRQPLYANAPPKPKRLNTSRDNSYSPDRTSSDKEMGDYGEMPHRQHPQDQGGYMPPVTRHQQYLNHNGERRTPDAYARSRVGPEYEDAYRNGQPVPYYNQMQPYHRPHSADFLEHPVMRTKPAGANRTDPYVRPKSSVEQYNASEYWSEESYAQAMRGQSAIYTPPGMQTGTYVPPVQTSPVRSAKRSSFKQLPNGMYPVSPPVNHHSPQPQTPQMMPDQQNFIRSASARLPRYKIPIDGHMNSTYPDDGSGYIDRKKMQQREESMKRLLEWKQRMLQSPLTRKSSPKPDSPKPHSDMERYRKQVLQELAHHEGRRPAGSQRSPAEQSAWRHRHPSAGPQPRSSREPQYNSYSSDDEDVNGYMRRAWGAGPGSRGMGGGDVGPRGGEKFHKHLRCSPDYVNVNQYPPQSQGNYPPDMIRPSQPSFEYCYETQVPLNSHSRPYFNDELSLGKYSDSGYDTMRVDSLSRDEASWSRDEAMLSSQRQKNLTKDDSELWKNTSSEKSKSALSPRETLERIRKKKESPPKNIVQQRIRVFEQSHTADSGSEEQLKATVSRSLSKSEPELPQITKKPSYSEDLPSSKKKSSAINNADVRRSLELLQRDEITEKVAYKKQSSAFSRSTQDILDGRRSAQDVRSFAFSDHTSGAVSDTEMLECDRDAQSEDRFTTKSEPFSSGSGSVLADLRRSADRKKERDYREKKQKPAIPPKPKLSSSKEDLVEEKSDSRGRNVEVIMTPGYLRLSMVESMEQSILKDSDSEDGDHKVTPPFQGFDGNPTNTPNRDHEVFSRLKHGHPHDPKACRDFPDDLVGEDTYLPMTPPRKPVLAHTISTSSVESAQGQHSRTPSQTIVMESLFQKTEYEENTYVDMTEDIISSKSVFESSTVEKSGMIRPSHLSPSAHYELLYKSYSGNYEPIYNEIPSPSKLAPQHTLKHSDERCSSESQKKKSPKNVPPDILSSANPESNSSASDADDEASKDLDSLGPAKSKTKRFSLSDTFRPASYYLGRSAENLSDKDSSDSDLVSPPPIPNSPPPMEELENDGCSKINVPDPPGKLRKTLSDARMDVAKRKSLEESERQTVLNTLGASHHSPENQDSPPTSPLEKELNYSYYRVYQDENRYAKFKTDSDTHSPRQGASRHVAPDVVEQAVRESSNHNFQQKGSDSSSAGSIHESNHQRGNSNASDSSAGKSGAPYYYADLLSPEQIEMLSPSAQEKILKSLSLRARNQLNNHRDFDVGGKRNDVGKRVNHLRDSKDSATDLKRTAVEYFGVAKCGEVDERNMYESSSQMLNQKFRKTRSLTPDPSLCLMAKDQECASMTRRSRSVERLLEETNGATGITPVSMPPDLEDPWEKDQVWSENLRRESLRHTRSLEALDEDRPERSPIDGRYSPSEESHRSRKRRSIDGGRHVRRDVQYVNDIPDELRQKLIRRRKEYTDYRMPKDDPASVGDDGQYDRLSEFSPTLERARRGETYVDGYYWDEAQQRFRVKKRGDHFLGDSLPPPPPGQGGGRPSESHPHPHPPPPPAMVATISCENAVPSFYYTEAHVDRLQGIQVLRLLSNLSEKSDIPPCDPNHRALPCVVVEKSDDRKLGNSLEGMGGQCCPIGCGCGGGGRAAALAKSNHRSNTTDSIAAMTRENLVVKAAQQNHHAQFAEQPSRSPKKSPLRGVESGSETGSTPPPPAPAPAPVPPAPSTSSGDLSSKSHEELVLLLIQLRRQSSGILKSIEGCQKELDAQKRIIDMEASSPSRDGHLVRHRKLADQLNELQTQYEIQRPLIHLVDNMVKLGSIYGEGGQGGRMRAPEEIQEKLDFNHWIQERRMVAQDRKQWEKESPDQQELEAKIEQLYHLEVILRREAKVLQTLQKDKELLEGALQSVRLKLQQLGNSNPQEMEKLQRQQQQLERELGHVRSQLLQSSKKLEEAETENSRLEHELMVLRQKVLLALKHATSLQAHNLATQQLESELMRVQQLTRDLQRRRMELSKQVQQLTERCETSGSTLPKPTAQVRPSPSGVAGAAPIPARRKHSDVWLETDLDSAVSMDRGVDRLTSEIPPHLYVNTSSYDDSFWYMSREDPYGEKQGIAWEDQMDHTYQKATYHQPVYQTYQPPPPPPPPPPTSSVAHIALGDGSHMFMDISEADDRMKRFYGILPKEKSLEIKTVRTVKREAQQRQKRRPSMESGPGIPGRPSDEEPDEEDPDPATVIENDPVLSQFQRSMSLPRSYGLRKYPNWKEPMNSSHINHPAVRQQQAVLLRRSAANLRNLEVPPFPSFLCPFPNSQDYEDSVDAAFIGSSSPSVSPPSPKYRSETAQAIIQEMHLYRRKIPREKRKHITVSSSRPVTLETVRKSATWRGARDDLELSGGQLGQNLGHTPAAHRHSTPDVVKSTMPHRKEVKYNEETIDTILGTPQKILIPERYVPEDAVLSKEEQAERSRKAEAIKKMLLSESALASSEDGLGGDPNEDSPSLMKQKVALERRQREQLLSLSQTLAREASARTRRVAVQALQELPAAHGEGGPSTSEESSSPTPDLPLVQQRENLLT
ncbi:unnamed protein product [Darwinula stevensoni]|uniref:PH domain-containing protein n=1 Tax=Darwinula stevensoni TaxID=69355 RepID=A0A7R9A8M8_9CRUS|nr:unnamed protein product [Darwinula stevensoni]CAG0896530.1 unnamed protein product [Darwinula stevensoni]